MTNENSKGMKDLSASNVSHVSWKSLQCAHITTLYAFHVVEVAFGNQYNMICCYPIEHGFLTVFSTEEKLMLYSETIY